MPVLSLYLVVEEISFWRLIGGRRGRPHGRDRLLTSLLKQY